MTRKPGDEKRRVELQDLEQPARELKTEEAEAVQGGIDIAKAPSPHGPIPIPYPNFPKR